MHGLSLIHLFTGVVVSVSGVIGFVGLVVPHVMRGMVGSGHKRLVPMAILGGGLFTMVADLISRVIIAPEEQMCIRDRAYSLENPHGARTGYVVLDFTRDNFDNVFSGFYSLTDTILILDDHRKPVYCSRPDYSEAQISGIIAELMKPQGTAEAGKGAQQYLCLREPCLLYTS